MLKNSFYDFIQLSVLSHKPWLVLHVLEYCFPLEHGFEHFDILDLFCRSRFDITVQNEQLRGFPDFDGTSDLFQMRLLCRIDRVRLERFPQADTFLRLGGGHVLV